MLYDVVLTQETALVETYIVDANTHDEARDFVLNNPKAAPTHSTNIAMDEQRVMSVGPTVATINEIEAFKRDDKIHFAGPWTTQDGKTAYQEGWNLFSHAEGLRLSARTVSPIFSSQEAVERFVWFKAMVEQSPLHKRALRVLAKENPQQFQTIVTAALTDTNEQAASAA